MARRGSLEDGAWPSAITCPNGCAKRCSTPPPSPRPPVAREFAEGREANDFSVGSNACAVEPAPAYDCNPPLALGARAKHRESVVADDGSACPAESAKLKGDPPIVNGNVGACHAINRGVSDWFAARVNARIRASDSNRLVHRLD